MRAVIDLRESWRIGPVEVPTRVVLAPMAGVSVQAFRRQGRRFGAGLVCSEMVSCAGIEHRNERTLGYLRVASDEHPLAIQIFGSEPSVMADAARLFGPLADRVGRPDPPYVLATIHREANTRQPALGRLVTALSGLGERVIYREMFPAGLTMIDSKAFGSMGLAHVAARQELREMMAALQLPDDVGEQAPTAATGPVAGVAA